MEEVHQESHYQHLGVDIASSQKEHFIASITSSHIVQDFPNGERSITLSNKETIKTPNVIRVIIPERVVKQ